MSSEQGPRAAGMRASANQRQPPTRDGSTATRDTATVPVAIARFAQQYETQHGQMAAAAVIATIPALLLMALGQRFSRARIDDGIREMNARHGPFPRRGVIRKAYRKRIAGAPQCVDVARTVSSLTMDDFRSTLFRHAAHRATRALIRGVRHGATSHRRDAQDSRSTRPRFASLGADARSPAVAVRFSKPHERAKCDETLQVAIDPQRLRAAELAAVRLATSPLPTRDSGR